MLPYVLGRAKDGLVSEIFMIGAKLAVGRRGRHGGSVFLRGSWFVVRGSWVVGWVRPGCWVLGCAG
jgi:hypothetical protein